MQTFPQQKMTSIMSEFHSFDPDEMANCFEFGGGDFDFEREFIADSNDFASDTVANRMMGSSPNASDGSAAAEQTNSSSQNFPVLLHEIVSNEDYECIHWLPCGTMFAISDKDAFTTQVIPTFFDARGGTKFTSFTRRLKRWNFNRISSGANIGSYYHEKFLRGQPDMAATILYPTKVLKKSSPASVVKSAVKARRRASTGCMVEPEKLTDFGCTPIPVKSSVQTGDLALFDLDSDMAELLASPDFVSEYGPASKKPEAGSSGMFTTPPFSQSTLEPAPVTDLAFKDSHEIIKERTPTSTQSEKLHLASTYQPKTKSNLPFQASSQSLLHNTPMNVMQQMQYLAFPGVFNSNQLQQQQQLLQQQTQTPVFQHHMRRHSCMPMFSASNMDAASLFVAPHAMGVYSYQPIPSTTSFNPMLQINNMPLNQNIDGRNKLPEQKVSVSPKPCEVTSKDVDQDDKWIDFDEYVARQDD